MFLELYIQQNLQAWVRSSSICFISAEKMNLTSVLPGNSAGLSLIYPCQYVVLIPYNFQARINLGGESNSKLQISDVFFLRNRSVVFSARNLISTAVSLGGESGAE